MNLLSSQGKSTIRPSKRGSIEITIIFVALVILLILPLLLFLLNVYMELCTADKIDEIIQLASINSLQNLDSESLGAGILSFDAANAKLDFKEEVERELQNISYISPDNNSTKITYEVHGKNITVSVELTFIGIMRNIRKIKREHKFYIDLPNID